MVYGVRAAILQKVLDFFEEQKLLSILGDSPRDPLLLETISDLLLVGAQNERDRHFRPKSWNNDHE